MKTLFATLLLAVPLFAAGPITVTTIPPVPLIEEGKSEQILNFDLMVTNPTAEKLELEKIEATVLTADGRLVVQQRLDQNGDARTMSILTIPNRVVEPGGRLIIFNPFHAHETDVDLSRIRYDLTFDKGSASVTVSPKKYATKTDLILPVNGRVLIHDGHDFVSHHRRLDITGGMTTAMGIKSNFLRYANDFVIVDEEGRMYKGDGEKNEDWYGFGAPLVAPGAGVVVAAHDGVPDNTKSNRIRPDMDAVMKNLFLILGNHVMIDHGNGEYSFLAHMKNGSVAVKAGDRVKQGQKLGEMGFSGDAFLVHLHYQLQSDTQFGEGLPSYFREFKRFNGTKWVAVKRGAVDSGDVVMTAIKP
jgi:hypothetical protein